MKLHLCIGGPLDGQLTNHETPHIDEYMQYNSASGGGCRSKTEMRWHLKQGWVINPTMVLIHKSVFKKAEKLLLEA